MVMVIILLEIIQMVALVSKDSPHKIDLVARILMETDILTQTLQGLMVLFGLLMIMPTFGLVMSLNGLTMTAILLETIHLVLMEIYAQE